MKKVYLAGKITKNGWRSDIFSELRDAELYNEKGAIHPPSPVDGFSYSGPYFLTCDHGCYHGEYTHGRGNFRYGCGENADNSSTVLKKCQQWITQSDFVFVWIDSVDAYGTVAEVGFAKAMSKPLFLAYDESFRNSDFFKDTWFIQSMADDVVISKSAKEAWSLFAKRYEAGSVSNRSIRPASVKQISFVQTLLSKNGKKLSFPIDELTMEQAGILIAHFNLRKPLPKDHEEILLKN
ncbi:hypothetical protein JJB07_03075 [Tumebacillus sp. ITR2]|uniref:Nucleoside 2-deoxyribosyltransferase n=1 Tax=Tumebacillus amylolyticus TaxID=2801339 RepID=A0ABS1J5R4_9BACL|nr:hypothetical protein [Tumebacillus amylolyticus]MBL0385623.1 hypothetical protein [Tumebacillus amylolyticus]